MKDMKISDMLDMSMELWEENKEKWSPMEPEHGRTFILYMIEEIGEVISVIKKKSTDEIMNDKDVREHFVTELGDVMMYFMDVLNRYGISAEEFSELYRKKFNKNMKRDYEAQYKNLVFDESESEA